MTLWLQLKIICLCWWETYLRIPKRGGTLHIDVDRQSCWIEPD